MGVRRTEVLGEIRLACIMAQPDDRSLPTMIVVVGGSTNSP